MVELGDVGLSRSIRFLHHEALDLSRAGIPVTATHKSVPR